MWKAGKLWKLVGDHHKANKHHNAIWRQLQTMCKNYFEDINTAGLTEYWHPPATWLVMIGFELAAEIQQLNKL